MNSSQLLAALTSTCWMMEPMVLERVCGVLLRHSSGVRLDVTQVAQVVNGRPQDRARAKLSPRSDVVTDSNGRMLYQRVGSVAVVPIAGVIAKRASMVNGSSQQRGTSLEAIDLAMRTARADDQVGSIMLRADSPGGSADGLKQAADSIFASRAPAGSDSKSKPVWSFIDGLAASAAYYLVSQAEKVFLPLDGMAGSIGTYIVAVDSSRQAKNEGVDVHLIRSDVLTSADGKVVSVKGEHVPGVAISEAAIAHWRGIVNALQEMFTEAVARGRGMSAAQVGGVATGHMWVGKAAVAQGLADGVDTIENVIGVMNQRFSAPAAKVAGVNGGRGVMVASARNVSRNASNIGKVNAMDVLSVDGYENENQNENGASLESVSVRPALLVQAQTEQTAAERNEQMSLIDAAAAGFKSDEGVLALANAAVRTATVDASAFQTALIAYLAKSRAPLGGGVNGGSLLVGDSGSAREARAMELMLLNKMDSAIIDRAASDTDGRGRFAANLGYANGAEVRRAFSEAESNGLRRFKLMDMAQRSVERRVQAQGLRFNPASYRYDDDVLAAAFGGGGGASMGYGHGSSDFPSLLSNVQNKVLMASFLLWPTIYEQFCRIGSSNDFKTTDIITLSALEGMKLIPEGLSATEATLNERKQSIKISTQGRKLSWTRQMFINDDLGGFTASLQRWGVIAKLAPEVAVMTILSANSQTMPNGNTLFSAGNRNLAGTATALSNTSLEAAYLAMVTQRDFGSEAVPITITPRFLITPPQLGIVADRLTMSPYDSTSGEGNNTRPNVFAGGKRRLVALDSPYLGLSPGTATAWYLAGDPAMYPLIQVNFLQGRREPILTPVGNGSILGQEQEIIYDFGAVAVQHESGYKNAGA